MRNYNDTTFLYKLLNSKIVCPEILKQSVKLSGQFSSLSHPVNVYFDVIVFLFILLICYYNLYYSFVKQKKNEIF